MVASLAFFFKSAAVTSLLILLLGLIEPWWVLWFEATQNRLKVIKVYGTVGVLCWMISYLIQFML